MDIITLDFETYFTKDYSLGKGKMTTEEYVRDPRFRAHGAGVRLPNGRTAWLDHRQLSIFICQVDWSKTAVLAHHAHFDGLILAHRYGVKPCFWFDTLAMARMMLGNHLPKGLDALARHFGLGAKRLNYEGFRGLYWDQMTRDVQLDVADGSVHDCNLTWDLFSKHLAQTFPRSEYELVDMTVRMFTEPMLEGDVPLLEEIEREERERKDDMLAQLGLTEGDLQSTARFQELLEDAGIEIAFKPGRVRKDGNVGVIPAFAKNDEFMRELCNDEDEYVALLANARLGVKSTGLETRARTLREMSQRGKLCVYLNYCGAHTTRWSGGEATNFQNLKRRHKIRNTLRASAGYLLATPDASQIECRFLNVLAGNAPVVELFRRGGDPYVALASAIYQHEVYKPADDDPRKAEMEMKRGTGKQGELSCGYMSGWKTFRRTAALGTYGPPQKLTEAEARHAVDTYRRTHKPVCDLWDFAGQVVLPALAHGGTLEWGPTVVSDHRIWLPNGAPLIYEKLEWHEGEWRLLTRAGWTKMYGGKLVENWIQAIAGTKTREDMATIARAGLRVVGMSHDEIWVMIPEQTQRLVLYDGVYADHEDPQAVLDWCCKVIATPPRWCPDVPLGAEGKMGGFYAK